MNNFLTIRFKRFMSFSWFVLFVCLLVYHVPVPQKPSVFWFISSESWTEGRHAGVVGPLRPKNIPKQQTSASRQHVRPRNHTPHKPRTQIGQTEAEIGGWGGEREPAGGVGRGRTVGAAAVVITTGRRQFGLLPRFGCHSFFFFFFSRFTVLLFFGRAEKKMYEPMWRPQIAPKQ